MVGDARNVKEIGGLGMSWSKIYAQLRVKDNNSIEDLLKELKTKWENGHPRNNYITPKCKDIGVSTLQSCRE